MGKNTVHTTIYIYTTEIPTSHIRFSPAVFPNGWEGSMDHIVQNCRPGSSLDGLGQCLAKPTSGGLESSRRCAGFMSGPVSGRTQPARYQSVSVSLSDSDLANCARFWPRITLRPASGQCFPADPDRMLTQTNNIDNWTRQRQKQVTTPGNCVFWFDFFFFCNGHCPCQWLCPRTAVKTAIAQCTSR